MRSMRLLSTVLASLLAFTPAAFAASNSEDYAIAEATCKAEYKITEARLKNPSLLHKLRECIDIELRTLENTRQEGKLVEEREALITTTTEKFLRRYRGKTPSTVQRTSVTKNAVVRTTKISRPSPRTVRANARTRGAITGSPLTDE